MSATPHDAPAFLQLLGAMTSEVRAHDVALAEMESGHAAILAWLRMRMADLYAERRRHDDQADVTADDAMAVGSHANRLMRLAWE